MRARWLIHGDDAAAWANERGAGPRLPSLAEAEYGRLVRVAPDSMAVYVLQAGASGPLKIGCVWRVKRLPARISALQTGSAEPLYLRRLIATRAEDHLEVELHDRFAEWRLEGEWFAPAPSVVEFACGLGC